MVSLLRGAVVQSTVGPVGTQDLIPESDLRPGDVLLSCGTEALSQLIRRLGGGDYSHAALWDGHQAVDATGHGVVRRDLQEDKKAQWYIDAYRWHSPPPNATDLGDVQFPSAPVIARSDRIVAAKTQFAYDELIMAALVIVLSKEPSDKWLRRSVRLLLSRVQQWVHEHVTAKPGTTAMTCSETVAVSFDEASPPNYAIEVEVDPTRDYDTIVAVAQGGTRQPPASSYDALKERYAELVARALPAIALLQVAVAAGSGGTSMVSLPPGCVTPHDLQTSPSLTRLGRLSQKVKPPPSASESTWRLFVDLVREYWPKPPKTLSRQ